MDVHQKTICFTGFEKNKKNELTSIAGSHNYFVKSAVTKDLDYLCCGENAGPSKISKARQNGTILLSENEFIAMISNPTPLDSLGSNNFGKSQTDAPEPASEKPNITIYDDNEFLDYLWTTIEKGITISIIYHGGSRSGERRDIVPLSMTDNFVLRAVDLSSPGRDVKSFSLGSIEIDGIARFIPPNEKKSSKPQKKQYQLGIYKKISDVYEAYKDTLLGMSWYVATYSNDDNEIYRLDICDFFKNGKPRKTPIVTLYFESGNETRPFVCKCREGSFVSTYRHLDHAAEIFISLAYEISQGGEDD
ncbi:BRCT domain-containing protein [Gibbsiella quercinecans]|uniref:BRCT domain-containing protein n=1 Tax=Gibbsiella quercinecans TaxID=929813 RepID=UPI000EF16F7E|nr:BRCT domain-containing protein [Gibbsiella quercinecans]RLM12848.1 hypothetical protein BIY31_00245 [Gibbsiella quercinecans]